MHSNGWAWIQRANCACDRHRERAVNGACRSVRGHGDLNWRWLRDLGDLVAGGWGYPDSLAGKLSCPHAAIQDSRAFGRSRHPNAYLAHDLDPGEFRPLSSMAQMQPGWSSLLVMDAHIEQSEPASEVLARELAQTLLTLAIQAGSAGARQSVVLADPFGTLSTQIRLLVAAMSDAKCRDTSDTSDITIIVTPSGDPPAHYRCSHSPPHCYDLDLRRLPDCP